MFAFSSPIEHFGFAYKARERHGATKGAFPTLLGDLQVNAEPRGDSGSPHDQTVAQFHGSGFEKVFYCQNDDLLCP